MKKKTKKTKAKMIYYYYVFTATTLQTYSGTLETEIKKFPIHYALKFMVDLYKVSGCITFFSETSKQEYEVFSNFVDKPESKSVQRRKKVMKNEKTKNARHT